MATLNLRGGESFIKGRSGAKAKELLVIAGDRGAEVRTTSHGYIVPSEILPEGYDAITSADLPAVTTEPGTPTNVEDVWNKGGARNAPVGTPLAEADEAGEEAPAGDFDPSKATIDEVKEYLDGADDDERARVIAAEEAGKQRKGVLDLATTEEGK